MDTHADTVDEYIDLRDAVESLPERQREIVILYSLGYTQCEIAEKLGISQPRISYILRNAFCELRKKCYKNV